MEKSMDRIHITKVLNHEKKLPKELEVNSLYDYINAIKAIYNYHYPKKVLFRGLTKTDYVNEITPSLYRDLKKIYKDKPSRQQLREHCESLLRKAENLSVEDIKKYEDNEIRLLAHLQHNGLKTIFIDYTYSPLVALWFACHPSKKDKEDKNSKENKKNKDGTKDVEKQGGCVIAIERDMVKLTPIDKNCKEIKELFSDRIRIFEPPSINRRIISQQSVLLASLSGFIHKSMHIQITIPDNKKAEILEELEIIGINKKMLFLDFGGFPEWSNLDKNSEIMDTIDDADRHYAKFDYPYAIELYNQALNLIKRIECEKIVKLIKQMEDEQTIELIEKIEDEHIIKLIEQMECGQVIKMMEQMEYEQAINKLMEHMEREQVIRIIKPIKVKQAINKLIEQNNKDDKIKKLKTYTYINIGICYKGKGEYDEALKWYEKAKKIQKEDLNGKYKKTNS
jgi:tetratricopeptide (TPR) repeat protein